MITIEIPELVVWLISLFLLANCILSGLGLYYKIKIHRLGESKLRAFNRLAE